MKYLTFQVWQLTCCTAAYSRYFINVVVYKEIELSFCDYGLLQPHCNTVVCYMGLLEQ